MLGRNMGRDVANDGVGRNPAVTSGLFTKFPKGNSAKQKQPCMQSARRPVPARANKKFSFWGVFMVCAERIKLSKDLFMVATKIIFLHLWKV